MSLTKPISGDPGFSGATRASTVIGAIVDAITQQGINVKTKGAAGDGSTDDTTAFAAAASEAGSGGTILVPAATYRLDNWTPTQSGLTVVGAGMGSSILKAKTSAAAAVTISQLSRTQWKGITFDGNAKASDGLRITGATLASSLHRFADCTFQNSIVGCSVLHGSPTNEADQNSFDHCWFSANTTGFKDVSLNGQNQLFNNCRFGGTETNSIEVAGSAGLYMNSCQLTDYTTTGILISSSNGTASRFLLNDTGFQSNAAGAIDIDGTNAWPVYGVELNQCTLLAGMSAGSGYCVKMGQGQSVLVARRTAFVNGNVDSSAAANCIFHDEYCKYTSSSVVESVSSRHFQVLSSSAPVPTYSLGGTAFFEVNWTRGVIRIPRFTTAGRPTAANAGVGATYYDTTLSKPGWSDGTNWKDAAGTNI
jgi:hypothetical protein